MTGIPSISLNHAFRELNSEGLAYFGKEKLPVDDIAPDIARQSPRILGLVAALAEAGFQNPVLHVLVRVELSNFRVTRDGLARSALVRFVDTSGRVDERLATSIEIGHELWWPLGPTAAFSYELPPAPEKVSLPRSLYARTGFVVADQGFGKEA